MAKEEKPRICGFCMTGHHENCKKEIVYYEKVWLCYCEHGIIE